MAARDWIFSLEATGIKLGLSQMTGLLGALGHPERLPRIVTVAGTNGKGSVAAMIDRGLRAGGLRVGRYTSPHLVDIEERIVIDGRPIAPEAFEALAVRIRTAAVVLEAPPSFFEATTALALVAFADAQVDAAVLEVGLGGRLDATNAADAALAVITSIGIDHVEYLGGTLPEIAREKAGIIKPGACVIVAPNPPAVTEVVRLAAAGAGATLIEAGTASAGDALVGPRGTTLRLATAVADYGLLTLGLPGRHQISNAVTAVTALEAAARLGWIPSTPAVVRDALVDVDWPARLEWLRTGDVDVLIDGAHNPDGAAALAAFLAETISRPVPLVLGTMRDKATECIIDALAGTAAMVVATAAPTPRALPAERLAALVRDRLPDRPILHEADPMRAVSLAAAHGTPVVVAGSLYLAGFVRQALLRA